MIPFVLGQLGIVLYTDKQYTQLGEPTPMPHIVKTYNSATATLKKLQTRQLDQYEPCSYIPEGLDAAVINEFQREESPTLEQAIISTSRDVKRLSKEPAVVSYTQQEEERIQALNNHKLITPLLVLGWGVACGALMFQFSKQRDKELSKETERYLKSLKEK
ncbi:MAG: hypothetical protein Q7R96_04740 [Nanoarchaeota archaeon]|nr:hypothetical protein [Nanoarchaeota archaeon]